MADRPEDDPEVRKKLREIGQAADRAAFEQGKHRNPLYALRAITRYQPDEELPLWVREWMLGFAAKALFAAIYRPATPDRPEQDRTMEEAVKEILQALGLTSQGWNAVEEFLQAIDDDLLAVLRTVGKISATDIAVALQSPKDDRDGIEVHRVYRRTNRARRRWPRVKG